jgi:hypothetical protein
MLLDPYNGLLITLAKGLQAKQWRCAVQLLWTLVCLSLLLAACGRTPAQPAIQDGDGVHVDLASIDHRCHRDSQNIYRRLV